jgi:hypothetical protein
MIRWGGGVVGDAQRLGKKALGLAWVLENRRLALRNDRLGFIIQSLLQSACMFLVAGRLAREF